VTHLFIYLFICTTIRTFVYDSYCLLKHEVETGNMELFAYFYELMI